MAYFVTAIGDHFAIRDDAGRFYSKPTRGGFISNQSHATLFASQAKADEMVRQLREMEMLDRPIREFKAKVKIRVLGNPEFNKADLLDFLKRSVAVSVEGNGPVPDSLLTVTLDWDSIKQTKKVLE